MVYVEEDSQEPVIADHHSRWPTRPPKQRSSIVRWFIIGGVVAAGVFVILVIVSWSLLSSALSSLSL